MEFKNEWVTTKIDSDTVKWASEFGSMLAKNKADNSGREMRDSKLTTSQLRKFFGEVKRQQALGFNSTDFILLKPKLAYAVGRTKKPDSRMHDFYKVMSKAIDQVKDEKQFKNFIKLFEAIVAYHKAAEESKLEIN
ncbi:MAG TPA: type III-A CRISPR-associated protein Csm2 [Candidatus Paceibacterota bacterium]|nr:type III-A CRISPR-associated protein Csm2 [Candidatus Paceibacterota bacterium]